MMGFRVRIDEVLRIQLESSASPLIKRLEPSKAGGILTEYVDGVIVGATLNGISLRPPPPPSSLSQPEVDFVGLEPSNKHK